MHRPPFGPDILEGIRDALQLVLDSLEKAENPQRTQMVTAVQLREAAEAISDLLEDAPRSVPEWYLRFKELEAQAENLLDIAQTLSSEGKDGSRAEVLAWARAVRDSVQSRELRLFDPGRSVVPVDIGRALIEASTRVVGRGALDCGLCTRGPRGGRPAASAAKGTVGSPGRRG